MSDTSGRERPPAFARERRLLQIAVAIAAILPVSAGGTGVLFGVNWLAPGSVSFDSHFRYLSGLLVGIGLLWWVSTPKIERHSARILALTLVVVAGGLARLLALVAMGRPNAGMLAGLAMELIATPALCLWQRRVARLAKA